LFGSTFTCELFSNKTLRIVSNFTSNIDDVHWLNVNQNSHDLLSNLVIIRFQLIYFLMGLIIFSVRVFGFFLFFFFFLLLIAISNLCLFSFL
jgi:hypothetical protein